MTLGKKSTAKEAAAAGRAMSGKRVVVTGATSGIGVETARALAGAGANIVVAVRDANAGARLAMELGGTSVALDLTDFASARAAAAQIATAPVDVVICNAGVMAPPLSFTKQGFELQMGTNHLGHFVFVDGLRAALSPDARVVVVASSAHRRGTGEGVLATLDSDRRYQSRRYSAFTAYGDAKVANILFAKALAKRLPKGQSAFSLHPGVIATNLTRSLGVGAFLWNLASPFMKSAAQGAATSVYVATAPGLESRSGAFFADCAEQTPSSTALDDALAERVWSLSDSIARA